MKEIIAGLGRGDVPAFNEIYRLYADVVFHFAHSLTNDVDLAGELTQQVFVKLWENREKTVSVTSLRSYLLAMIKNQVLNHYRQESIKKRHVENASRERLAAVDESEHASEGSGNYLILAERAIAMLPPKRRRIFEMSRKERMTYEQIADRLGLSKTVVKKQILMALRNIRDYLVKHRDAGAILLWVILL